MRRATPIIRRMIAVALFATAVSIFTSGCGSTEKLPDGVVAVFEGGYVTAAELTNYEHGRPSDLSPGFQLDLLIVDARDQGWIPEGPAACLLGTYRRHEAVCGLQYSEESLAMALTDEEIAGRIALEKIVGRRPLSFESGEHLDHWRNLEALIQQVFQVLEYGYRQADSFSVTEQEVRREYELRSEAYLLPARVDFRHLFLNCGLYPDQEKYGLEQAQDRCQDILDQLREGIPYSELIDQWSDSESQARGGWVLDAEPQLLRPEIRRTLAALDPGEFSEPITTPGGVHLLQLVRRHEPGRIPFEEVSETIHRDLLRKRRNDFYRDVVQQAEIPVRIDNPEDSNTRRLVVNQSVYTATEVNRLFNLIRCDDLDDIEESIFEDHPEHFGLDQIESNKQLQEWLLLAQALRYLHHLNDQPVEIFAQVERNFLSAYRTEYYVRRQANDLLERMKPGEKELQQFYRGRRPMFFQPGSVRLETALVEWPQDAGDDSATVYLNRQKRWDQVVEWIEKMQDDPDIRPIDDDWKIGSWNRDKEFRAVHEYEPTIRQMLLQLLSRDEKGIQSGRPVVFPEPVKTDEGLLVMRLVEYRAARQLDFDEARDAVEAAWREKKTREALKTIRRKILAESGFQLVREMLE